MSKSKEKITISVRQSTAEVLRERSQEVGGSNRYMGEVVDELVDFADQETFEIVERLRRIENMLEQPSPRVSSTHTASEIDPDLIEKIENVEAINPIEFDLSQLKGTQHVIDAICLVVKDSGGITQAEISDLIQGEFEYSVNSVRSKRNTVLSRLEPAGAGLVPDEQLENWVREEIEQDWHKAWETGYKSFSAHRNVDDPEEWFLSEYSNSLEDYLGTDASFELFYVHPDEIEKYIQILKSQVQHSKEVAENEYYEIRHDKVLNYLNSLE